MVAKIFTLEQKLNVQRQDISDRLRALIVKRFPQRGRFGELEKVSGISTGRWKNLFYRKQEATTEMVECWLELFPEDVSVIVGRLHSDHHYPFNAPMPDPKQMMTVTDRMRWVIAEWAGAHADRIFIYLESQSDGKVSAVQWSQLILGLVEPTLEMVSIVCKARPMFSEWVILGAVQRKLG